MPSSRKGSFVIVMKRPVVRHHGAVVLTIQSGFAEPQPHAAVTFCSCTAP